MKQHSGTISKVQKTDYKLFHKDLREALPFHWLSSSNLLKSHLILGSHFPWQLSTVLRERNLPGHGFGDYQWFHLLLKDKSREEKKMYFLYPTSNFLGQKAGRGASPRILSPSRAWWKRQVWMLRESFWEWNPGCPNRVTASFLSASFDRLKDPHSA